ncbi:YeeE/YedE family protein [Candidatus Thioglobus sp.]|nr:YeeE/YedE family protein [Candidatus Thioglobus sp.]|tara:strand:- start:608 stop:1015 length:408 start_codon:yes stop_codon:yes gene_type:complete
MNDKLISLISGIIFGFGLVISGMTNPEKVLGFLSITHNWDASLIFVMGGAILVFAPFFFLLKNKEVSALGTKVELPKKQDLDKKLVIGSALFGVGWGLVGLCPGPAIAAIATFDPIVIVFLVSMYAGVIVKKKYN